MAAQRVEQPGDQSTFKLSREHRRMLAQLGYYLEKSRSRVLDFGCGRGELVYEYRDAGFDAYGVDIASSAQLRAPEDAQYFRVSPSVGTRLGDHTIDAGTYRIPFDDASFDLLVSSSVMEHVMDYEPVLREQARVLKPGGVAIHTFPPRYALVEEHTKVPLGAWIQNRAWFLFWALLGVRNEYQKGLGPLERARENQRYARTGTNYLRPGQIVALARKHFAEAETVPHLWEMGARGYVSRRCALMFLVPFYRKYYDRCRRLALFLRK